MLLFNTFRECFKRISKSNFLSLTATSYRSIGSTTSCRRPSTETSRGYESARSDDAKVSRKSDRSANRYDRYRTDDGPHATDDTGSSYVHRRSFDETTSHFNATRYVRSYFDCFIFYLYLLKKEHLHLNISYTYMYRSTVCWNNIVQRMLRCVKKKKENYFIFIAVF